MAITNGIREISVALANQYTGRTVRVLHRGTNLHLCDVGCGPQDVNLFFPQPLAVPMSSFRLSRSPNAAGIAMFIDGMLKNDFEAIHLGCKDDKKYRIPASVREVCINGPLAPFFPIVGKLRTNFIPVNPSPLDLFCNDIFRAWIKSNRTVRLTDSYLNAYQSLISTAFAFRDEMPPISDAYYSETAYAASGEQLLNAIMVNTDDRAAFKRFAASAVDITRPTRYLHFVDYLVSSEIGQQALAKPHIRILDVGGCPYSKKWGAPSARLLLQTLQRLYPEKTFEMVVSDRFYPTSFPIKNVEVDNSFPNLSYVESDIVERPPVEAGFDIVICNRVLTEPHFQGEANRARYHAARRNLYRSLKDETSVLFLDQGLSHWIEIWTGGSGDVNTGQYRELLNRIDHWFLVSMLQLLAVPRIRTRGIRFQLAQKFGDEATPPFLWATVSKYLKSIEEHDDRQAVILWRICVKTDGKPITQDIKDVEIPGFLRGLEPNLRREARILIDRISNPRTINLRGLNRLDSILAQGGLKIDRNTLFFSKLQSTCLDQAITSALGFERSFLELGGVISEVGVPAGNSAKRIYTLKFHLYRSPTPGKVHQVSVTVLPYAGKETHMVKVLK